MKTAIHSFSCEYTHLFLIFLFRHPRNRVANSNCPIFKHRRTFGLGRQRSAATLARSLALFYFATQKRPLRTLNGKLLLFRPLRGRNVRQTSAVLNGILQGLPLTLLHNPNVLLLQLETFDARTYIRHRPESHERRTLSVRTSPRCTCFFPRNQTVHRSANAELRTL